MKIKQIFEGRIERKNFILGVIIFWILKGIASIPTYIIFYNKTPIDAFVKLEYREYVTLVANSFSVYTIEGIIFLVLSLIVVLFSLNVYTRRLHDIGKSGSLSALVLLGFIFSRIFAHLDLFLLAGLLSKYPLFALIVLYIPNTILFVVGIFTLYLLLKKGQPNTNQYGEVPSDKISLRKVLLNN